MQTSSRTDLLRNPASKPLLFGLITAIVVGLVSSLFVLYLAHLSMIYHIILHIASLTLAIFLSVVFVLAYARSSSRRLLFMTLGFIALAVVVTFLYLLGAPWPGNAIQISTVGINLPHMILIVMLTTFFLGVVRASR